MFPCQVELKLLKKAPARVRGSIALVCVSSGMQPMSDKRSNEWSRLLLVTCFPTQGRMGLRGGIRSR